MKIVSGGQTGVDRAALDAAIALGLEHGGWCPRGRRAEDGTIPSTYPLKETPTNAYAQRTEWNVRDSDATLVLAWRQPSGGTALTIELAGRYRKPCLVVDLDAQPDPGPIVDWISTENVRTLNVAGPRESQHAGLHDLARDFLQDVLARAGGRSRG